LENKDKNQIIISNRDNNNSKQNEGFLKDKKLDSQPPQNKKINIDESNSNSEKSSPQKQRKERDTSISDFIKNKKTEKM
jgi:hypothetical protein